MEYVAGKLTDQIEETIKEATSLELVQRIWRKDASVWKTDEESQKIINNSLGWLTVPNEMISVVEELTEFADSIRSRGFKHVMVCGMGGSSLCPEVFAKTFGPQPGFPELLVLDSTDPDVLADYLQRIDVKRCLFVISSKSGSTTEPNTFYKFWYDQLSKQTETPGDNFIAITDPGSPLIERVQKLNFHRIFLNQPDIGGRYSALSYFGMLPAALMGIDVRKFLERASDTVLQCQSPTNEALQLGALIGDCANAGRDKLTLVIDDRISTLGLWIEQLVAESTGKESRGVLPVAGEPLGSPEVYGNDRFFVAINVGSASEETEAGLRKLAEAGHPVVYRELTDEYDLGSEFFTWEFATACAGWRIGINPFDQPNVQESKDATKELLTTFVNHGKLPEQDALIGDESLTIYSSEGSQNLPTTTVLDVLSVHLATIKPGDYVAFLDYVEETTNTEKELQAIRLLIRDRFKCATTTGYGPRFLHSTGQLHKGGPDTGVFIQLTANDAVDFAVPEESYTFSILKQAQALGDFRSLSTRGRRAIRVDLGDDTAGGLAKLKSLIARAVGGVGTVSSMAS